MRSNMTSSCCIIQDACGDPILSPVSDSLGKRPAPSGCETGRGSVAKDVLRPLREQHSHARPAPGGAMCQLSKAGR
jgi:hypothetical protein